MALAWSCSNITCAVLLPTIAYESYYLIHLVYEVVRNSSVLLRCFSLVSLSHIRNTSTSIKRLFEAPQPDTSANIGRVSVECASTAIHIPRANALAEVVSSVVRHQDGAIACRQLRRERTCM